MPSPSPFPPAKKSLGQHFLRDPGLAERIVDLLQIEHADAVLEIGPGPGALTGFIAARQPGRFVALEKDRHWAAHHAASGLVEAREGDALAFPWESLEGPWKIIGNLPYNVASPLIWDLVSRTPQLQRGVFMVQKEVGDRLRAAPGGKSYGGLSAWVQSHVRVERAFVLGPGAFSPPPKVDSAVVVMTPLPVASRPKNPQALAALIRLCFQQRRKQMQSLLARAGLPQRPLESLGIAPQARPETLSPALFQELSLALSEDLS